MNKKIFLLIFCYAISACLPHATIIPDETKVPTLEARNEITVTPAKNYPLPTVTSTSVDSDCLRITYADSSLDFDSGLSLSGLIPLIGYEFEPESFFYDLENQELTAIALQPNEFIGSFAVAPNRKLFGYFINNTLDLSFARFIVLDVEGTILIDRQVETYKYAFGIAGWLDDENILLYVFSGDSDISLKTPLAMKEINVFTGQESEIIPDYPDIYRVDPLIDWDNYSLSQTIYHPSKEFVIYPDKNGYLVLWNTSDELEIAKINAPLGFGDGPVWSPDGRLFVSDGYVGSMASSKPWQNPRKGGLEELFITDLQGNTEKITSLLDVFLNVDIGEYSWSPDSKQLAFWVSVNNNDAKDSFLAIVNIENRTLVRYCANEELLVENNRVRVESVAPIWSPDGKILVFQVRNGKGGDSTILLNLMTGIAYKISDLQKPAGWLVK